MIGRSVTRRNALRLGTASSIATIFSARVTRATATTRPGDDFYRYVNAAELDRMTVPEGRWDYGQFDRIADKVDAQLQSLIEATAANLSPASAAERIGIVYAALLNEQALEQRGARHIQRIFRVIRSAKTHQAVAAIMADPRSGGLIAFNVFPADGVWTVHVDQQNQSMPMLGLAAAIYTAEDDYARSVREAYRTYIRELFELAGLPDADRRAGSIVALETEIARRQWDLERLRDRRANLHIMTVEALEAYAPGLPWRTMLAARGVGDVERVNVGEDTAIALQARLFRETPVTTWQDWLAFSWLRNTVDVLPASYRDAYWRFQTVVRPGATKPTRKAEAFGFLKARMPMELGRLYVEAHFSEGSRASAAELLGYLKRAMAERIAGADWMDPVSQAEAAAKLDAMALKVGYPRTWPEGQARDLHPDNAIGNLDKLVEQEWSRQRARLTDASARVEPWYQAPQAVNASYSVLLNAIEVPAAILQPPFFSAKGHPAANFGAIGAIIGHEIGHGFDDQGLLYDSKGVMRPWLSPAAQSSFRRRAKGLVEQYSAFEPLPGVKLDGSRTLGENIGDLSGVSLALRAYELYRIDHPTPDEDRQDALRQLFRSWAAVWCYKAPDSAIRHIAANSYHVPPAYRVNGVVRNIDAWYRAFAIKPSDALYLPADQRISLW